MTPYPYKAIPNSMFIGPPNVPQVRYQATRGHLDMDVIRTSLGEVHIGTRQNVNINTLESWGGSGNIFDFGVL